MFRTRVVNRLTKSENLYTGTYQIWYNMFCCKPVLIISDKGKQSMAKRQMIFGIATRIDLLNFITENQPPTDEQKSPR